MKPALKGWFHFWACPTSTNVTASQDVRYNLYIFKEKT
jgi:hypothetical protein